MISPEPLTPWDPVSRLGTLGMKSLAFSPTAPETAGALFAEMLISRTDELAQKPSGVPHLVAAAAATPGVTALQCLRDLGRLQAAGGRVLVTGVSGGVGPLAVGVADGLAQTSRPWVPAADWNSPVNRARKN